MPIHIRSKNVTSNMFCQICEGEQEPVIHIVFESNSCLDKEEDDIDFPPFSLCEQHARELAETILKKLL